MNEEEVKALLDRLAPDCLVVKPEMIRQLFSVEESAAYKILREIRSYSNAANLARGCCKIDLIRWLFRNEH